MSRTGISYLDVTQAISRLQGRGENLTVEGIRSVLGTGSNSTIARYLRQWRSEADQGGSIQGIPAELNELITGLWEKLQAKADQRILEAQQEIEQKLKVKNAELSELHRKSTALQSQTHQLEETLCLKEQENKAINEKFSAEQIELSKLQGYCSLAEQQQAQQKSENQRLHQLLNQVQKNLEHYQASMQALQQQQSLAMEKQRAESEQQIARLRQQMDIETSENRQFKLLYEQVTEALKKSETAREVLSLSLREQEIYSAALEARSQHLSEQYDKNAVVLADKSKCLIEVEQKLDIREQELMKLSQTLEQAEDKIKTLRHEKLFLVQEKASLEGQFKQFKASV